MRKFFEGKIYSAAGYLEMMISALLVVVILVLTIQLAGEVFYMDSYEMGSDVLSVLMGKALILAVGVEFVKMLCKHTPSTVIEVLMFATARQMVVEHLSPMQTLIGIISIAILFATRKFLFCSFDEVEKTVYRGTQKARLINALLKLDIPCEGEETLADVVKRELQARGEELGTGACVYYHGYALRIAKIYDNKDITRVEVIRTTNS